MNFLTRTAAVVLISTVFCGCDLAISAVAKMSGLLRNKPKIERLDVLGKEVHFVGMAHMAKPRFYEAATEAISGFQARGFTFFIERVTRDSTLATDTTVLKKFRYVFGIDPTLNYAQQHPVLASLIQRHGLVRQPSYQQLGATDTLSADMAFRAMIASYEADHGQIELDSCALATPLGRNGVCPTFNSHLRDEYILHRRNQKLAQMILHAPQQKIVVVYGLAHLVGLKEELRKMLATANAASQNTNDSQH